MSVVFITGPPSCGKTTRSSELSAFLASRSLCPIIINDESLSLSRSAYDDSKTEKPARNAFFSAVVRMLSNEADGGKRVVIADGMNYIKGFRYQLYCAAREARVRHVTVQIAAPPDECKKWNASRPLSEQYGEATLENLISRYEEPIPSNRWDSPHFLIPWIDGEISSLPIAEDILTVLTSGEVKRPNIATIATPVSTTDYLHTLDGTTTILIRSLLALQTSLGSGQTLSGTSLVLPLDLSSLSGPSSFSLSLPPLPPKTLTLPLLNRHKRVFVQMSKANGVEYKPEKVAELFALYLSTVL
ncbi:chromatin associated protein KTI12 [Atractiella rhizophila]|nr:chromatin associated protein KTI12 [Atractiella rhizophila]